MTRRVPWVLFGSILVPIVIGVVLHYLVLLSLPLITVICMLAFLVALVLDVYFRSVSLEARFKNIIGIVKLVVDALMGIRSKLLQLRRDEPITVGSFTDIFDEATSTVSGTIIDTYFKSLGIKSSNPYYEEGKKRELLEKARRNEITYEEAEELRNLLDGEKRQREQAGDVFGAILVGLLILFIFGVIADLLSRPRPKKIIKPPNI